MSISSRRALPAPSSPCTPSDVTDGSFGAFAPTPNCWEVLDPDQDADGADHFNDQASHANLASARRQIETWLGQAKRDGSAVAVAMMGMEEWYNTADGSLDDGIGHAVQSAIARRLYRMLDGTRLVVRLDARTFLIAASGLRSPVEIREVAREIMGLIALPVLLHDHEIEVKPYLGMSVFPDDGATAASLMQRAEEALGIRIVAGQAGIQFCTPEIKRNSFFLIDRDQRLHDAILDGGIGLHYQLQLNHRLRRYVSCEAFLHCNDPLLGSPHAVITLAEKTGSDFLIGSALLTRACRQVGEWQRTGSPLSRIGMHFSARQLFHPEFIDTVRKALDDTRLLPQHLEIELSQSTVLDDPNRAFIVLQALSQIGVGIVLDEFNAGAAALASLGYLPIDGIKIDQCLVAACIRDTNARDLIRGMASAAQRLNLSVAADGVDTLEQHALLAELGCHTLQGSRFGPPCAAEAISGPISLPRGRRLASTGDRRAFGGETLRSLTAS